MLGRMHNARMFDWAWKVSRLNFPVDRDEWDTTPQTVNSGYSASLNDVVLPAGRLQAPFFDPAADSAVNYGGIGAAIGHELTHAFDDDGHNTTEPACSELVDGHRRARIQRSRLPSLLDNPAPSSPFGSAY